MGHGVRSIKSILFESPLLLALLWFPLQVGLLVYWSRTRTPRSVRAVWGGLAAVVLLLIVQSLVTTTRERLMALCERIANAAERGNAAAVVEHVSPRFRADDLDYDDFVALVERALQRTTVERIRFSHFRARKGENGTVIAEFDASARIRRADAVSGTVPTRWRVTFEREGETWKILNAEALPAPFSPIDDLGDIAR